MMCILPGLPAFYLKKWLSKVKWYRNYFLKHLSMERVASCNILIKYLLMVRLFFSQEGTTQGDSLTMAMYAISTMPLIQCLNHSVQQVRYADDATAGGELYSL